MSTVLNILNPPDAQRKKWLQWIVWLILLAGVALRFAIYLQNRNLIIDEANITRNLYERDIASLMQPLSYEQYAPPFFLWILKTFSNVFGFSEYALRMYSLIAGIISLFLMYALLKKFFTRAYWYPLALMATAYIFIRYSSEIKQYMPDVMVALALPLLALRWNLTENKAGGFILKWFIAGSLAIWLSMPAVFMLAGVGIYYLLDALQKKTYKPIGILGLIGLLWTGQFLFYYFTILKPQISSDYLQNFHRNSFFSSTDWGHNWEVFSQLLTIPGGHTAVALCFNGLLFLSGIFTLIRNHGTKAWLVLTPFIALLIAALLHQYAIVPRLVLFILPVVLLITGTGFEILISVRPLAARVAFTAIAVFCITNSLLNTFNYNAEREYTTKVLDFVMEHRVNERQLYVHHGVAPTFIYYTRIHPGKEKYHSLADAHLLGWDSDYEAIGRQMTGKIAIIFTSIAPDELQWRRQNLEKYLRSIAQLEQNGGWAYIYDNK